MAHIVAELTLLAPDHGGRTTPVESGYVPQFYYDGQDWDARHEYPSGLVQPGQTTIAELTFLRPSNHEGKLYPGQAFLIREGNRIVGYGRVIDVRELSLLRLHQYLYVFGYCTPVQWLNNERLLGGGFWLDSEATMRFLRDFPGK